MSKFVFKYIFVPLKQKLRTRVHSWEIFLFWLVNIMKVFKEIWGISTLGLC